ncbi:hypothetical protein [Ulvibacter litoralis]|uniref:Uncharacterized protein n=1 Tax=Ulvibacter litoralis TaxID=227084 RepID=A0A1G7DMM5_9FLAO|nr:hypothetical protein [Ulvibacter litoralis]GHC43011.1 hypothetical protein GCM10008083_01610 [Ulvibacter litoralis]SDE52386.1 hypothetical protein SAMN05421855_1011052 [Ulvibacter litoralis]
MNKDRAVTYSLLAHIRNNGTLIKGPLDIFKPLVKRVISLMNNKGIYSGKSTMEIKKEFDLIYDIDIPIPVLNNVLRQIAKDINTNEKKLFEIYKDNAFSISEYTFLDYEETISAKESAINDIETLFQKFCESSDFEIKNSSSIFSFIEQNKFELSKYFSRDTSSDKEDFTAEAQFVNFFRKIPTVYGQIKDIYIGSIISGFIMYNPSETEIDVELLFDTNFIVGLLDLNTPESTHTCKTLVEIAKKQNFKVRVLTDTIEETKNLLDQKAKYFDASFLQRKVYAEDIYNACDRRGLKKNDLEKIADNLETELSKLGISIINDQKSKNEAKYSKEYAALKEYRHSKISALHDATAITHVKRTRNKNIKEFEKVNSWFVNNVTTGEELTFNSDNKYQPEIINADNLLNILWLSNPQTKLKMDADDLADIGLTSSIAFTLNRDLPKSKIIRELDDNIHKYASEDLSDSDIVRIATRITNKQLTDIKELNDLAQNKKEEFVRRLEEESNKQKKLEEHRHKRLEDVLKEFTEKSEAFYSSKKSIESNEQIKDKKLESLEVTNTNLREKLIDSKIKNWQRKSILVLLGIYALIGIIFIIIMFFNSWNVEIATNYITNFKSNFIVAFVLWSLAALLNVFGFKLVYDRYFNNSNINNKRKNIKLE